MVWSKGTHYLVIFLTLCWRREARLKILVYNSAPREGCKDVSICPSDGVFLSYNWTTAMCRGCRTYISFSDIRKIHWPGCRSMFLNVKATPRKCPENSEHLRHTIVWHRRSRTPWPPRVWDSVALGPRHHTDATHYFWYFSSKIGLLVSLQHSCVETALFFDMSIRMFSPSWLIAMKYQ